MTEKMTLAQSMIDSKVIPTDWIYENVFHFSEDQYGEYRDLINQDAKRRFRLNQIENEGNDPLETGKSYGTPHDLASMYGLNRYKDGSIPQGYADDLEDDDRGRPTENPTGKNTQDDTFGKDRLGNKGMKKDNDESDSTKPSYKGGSPLALEAKSMYNKHKGMFKNMKINNKQLIFEKDIKSNSLLDESQIRE